MFIDLTSIKRAKVHLIPRPESRGIRDLRASEVKLKYIDRYVVARPIRYGDEGYMSPWGVRKEP